MSRIVTHNESTSQLIPSGYTSGGTYTFTWRNPTNAYYNADHSNGTYARLTLASNRTNQRVSVAYLEFDKTPLNSIPDGANIVSVESNIKYYVSSTSYITAFSTQLYTNTTAKGNALTNRPTSATKYALTTGNWTVSELQNIRLYISATHNLSTSNAYIYLNGADITVNYSWDETIYAITTSSSVQGVVISAQDAEVTSGGTDVITVTGVSDLSDIKLMDNGTDVTSSLVRSGSNYTYTLNNVDADHSITIEASAIPTIPSFVKKIHNINKLVKRIRKTEMYGMRN